MLTRFLHSRRVRWAGITAVAVAATLSMSACQMTPGTTKSTAAASGTVSTAMPKGKVTLVVASSENSGMSKDMVDEFQKENPNITIKWQYTQSDDYNKAINLQLASNNSPDVAILNLLGTTVSSGLMLNLDPYAKAYGWDSKVSKTGLDQWRSGPNGGALGTGNLWALPAGYTEVGVFYNKQLASQIGMTGAPATLADFESDLAKAKAAGIVPLQVGNLTGGAANLVEPIAAAIDGPAVTNKWAYGEKGATIETAGNREAASLVQQWESNGYLPNGSIGIDGATAQARFADGQGLFTVTGTWNTQTLEKKMGDNLGFFTFPPQKKGDSRIAVGTSVAYGISAKSKHADAAAAFLNFMTSPAAAKIQNSYGFMPNTFKGLPEPQKNTVWSDIKTNWEDVNSGGGFIDYYSNVTSSMPDTLTQAGQTMIAGRSTVDQYLTALQTDWDKVHG